MPLFHVLHDERGWDFHAILMGLKAPYGVSLLTGLHELDAASGPPGSNGSDRGDAMVLLVVQTGSYDGLPPFFVEGDAADVQLLEAILRKREGRS